MVRAIFIRHGQSTANAGIFTPNFSEIPLTPLGEQQAEALAASWQKPPDLIAVSPYLRARQTALPTIARFPQVPVETWPIYEFTYWDPTYWSGGNPESYPEDRARFWRIADPDYRQGAGAETFTEFLGRARDALLRLQQQPADATVWLFCHGHFMQAVRFEVIYAGLSDTEKMERFHAFDEEHRVRNTECLLFQFNGTSWAFLNAKGAERDESKGAS